MGKLLGGLVMLFAIASGLIVLALAPALWAAVFDGGRWDVVGVFALLVAATVGIGTALDRAAKRAGWDSMGWKPLDQPVNRTRGQLPRSRSTEQHFMTTAVEEMLASDPSLSKPSSEEVVVIDGFLQTYLNADVLWQDVWAAVDAHRADVPPYEQMPYWSPRGLHGRSFPITSLAFWGAVDRKRIASDPKSARSLLMLLREDPNTGVARAAAESLRATDLNASEH